MDRLPCAAVDLANVPGLLATGLALVGGAWAFVKWLNRPRFVCGVPPSHAERESKGVAPDRLGEFSLDHEFAHRAALFARRFRPGLRRRRVRLVRLLARLARREGRASEHLSRAERDRLRRHPSSRVLHVRDGIVTLPVLFVNRGARTAPGYNARVLLYRPEGTRLHVVDVKSEGLDFYAYVTRPELVEDETRMGGRVPDAAIVAAYADYLVDVEGWSDGLWLWGSLAANSYEMVLVRLRVEDERPAPVYLVYAIDSADAWVRSSTFLQAFEIVPDR